MMGHPGKKLLFMGQDFGQLREWSEKRELDWELLNDENHSHLQAFVKELLTIYKKYPAMYELDDQPDGFEWINPNDGYRSIFSFVRHAIIRTCHRCKVAYKQQVVSAGFSVTNKAENIRYC